MGGCRRNAPGQSQPSGREKVAELGFGPDAAALVREQPQHIEDLGGARRVARRHHHLHHQNPPAGRQGLGTGPQYPDRGALGPLQREFARRAAELGSGEARNEPGADRSPSGIMTIGIVRVAFVAA